MRLEMEDIFVIICLLACIQSVHGITGKILYIVIICTLNETMIKSLF